MILTRLSLSPERTERIDIFLFSRLYAQERLRRCPTTVLTELILGLIHRDGNRLGLRHYHAGQ